MATEWKVGQQDIEQIKRVCMHESHEIGNSGLLKGYPFGPRHLEVSDSQSVCQDVRMETAKEWHQ